MLIWRSVTGPPAPAQESAAEQSPDRPCPGCHELEPIRPKPSGRGQHQTAGVYGPRPTHIGQGPSCEQKQRLPPSKPACERILPTIGRTI